LRQGRDATDSRAQKADSKPANTLHVLLNAAKDKKLHEKGLSGGK
jgi:hypothetical protein